MRCFIESGHRCWTYRIRFTRSGELRDLCDIYKEHQSVDGQGLLVECGSACCKFSIQHILDENNAKNCVVFVARRSRTGSSKIMASIHYHKII